ncbi:MAG: translation initiation factor IF-2 [Gemmatimonadaceae bacterium]|nr:translation initiation factor IF-2 [Gemmatimonadaceae bacterium]
MSKLRVHDLAGEFGITTEEVVELLRKMDVAVKSHLSPLSDDQVARIRARWEREKRARVATPAAPARRRRSGTAAAPAAEKKTKKQAAEAAPPPPPAAVETTGVRRRKKSDAVVEAAPGPEVIEATPVEEPKNKVEPVAPVEATAPPAEPPRPAAPRKPESEVTASAGGTAADNRGDTRSRPRPQPVVPGAPRPRPVATGSPYQPPRPVASATPGAATSPPRRDDRTSGGPPRRDDGARRGKKGKRGSVDQEAVSASIAKTMTNIRGAPRRGVRRPDDTMGREELAALRQAEVEREKKTVRVNEFITVSELAQILKVPATQIVGFAFKNLGLMVTINQRLDFDQIDLIASEFGFQAVKEEEYAADLNTTAEVEEPGDLVSRPPVVTIMGHVDHGKTSLLDYIRKANVVAGESGGITQHIGAYHVSLPKEKAITFLDTPGHEAFTAMRARGAQVTDIVVLVVAADDKVMPQTIEAISHAKNAGVPMIVAINKIDLPGAKPLEVKQDLLQHGVVLEEFGGTVLSTEISAKKGTGVDTLLEQILLQSEILDLKANPDRRATGAVVEAQLDAGKGPVATVLISSGTLRVGDDFICGMYSGRVRALLDERNKTVKEAGPAIPVQVLGIGGGVPMAGDQFVVVEDAMESREIAQRRQRLDREAKSRRTAKGVISLEDFMTQTTPGQKRMLPILIKADQGGPAEALADALAHLSNEEVSVDVVHRGVGAITESDILFARAAGAIIVGFHVRPDNNARSAAEREGVEIKLYKIIYEAVEDIRSALEGMLRPEEKEVILGEAEVRELFKVSRIGVIAGCSVRSGIINKTGRIRVIRDGSEVYDGLISSLRRFKDDAKEVREGFECGIGVENFNDVKVGDVLECYRKEQVARTLESAATA